MYKKFNMLIFNAFELLITKKLWSNRLITIVTWSVNGTPDDNPSYCATKGSQIYKKSST